MNLGNLTLRGKWKYELFRARKSGSLYLIEESKWSNLITTAGKNHILGATLAAATQITAWYVLLKGTGSVAAADIMSSHAGWAEINPYTGNRPAWTPGAVAAGSVDNSAAKASFTITSDTTVYGAALASTNTGATGTLYAAGDFTSSRAVVTNDVLQITATFTSADDGV